MCDYLLMCLNVSKSQPMWLLAYVFKYLQMKCYCNCKVYAYHGLIVTYASMKVKFLKIRKYIF